MLDIKDCNAMRANKLIVSMPEEVVEAIFLTELSIDVDIGMH